MESLYLIPVVVSTVLVVTYPFYNLFFDYYLFHEKVSYIQVVGLIMGFTGIVLYYNPVVSTGLDIVGITYAVIGGFLASLYFTTGRYLRSRARVELSDYVVPTYLSGALTTLVYNLVYGVDLINYHIKTYVFFLLLALIPMLGGHTLINYLLKQVKTTTLTSIALGEPVGAGILAYLILGQTIDWPKIVLSVLILGSIVLIIHGEKTST